MSGSKIYGRPDSNQGQTFDMASATNFTRSDGSNFIINCTADSVLTSVGIFSVGFGLNILNTGTHTISLDEEFNIGSGQHGFFIHNGTGFEGGV